MCEVLIVKENIEMCRMEMNSKNKRDLTEEQNRQKSENNLIVF